MIATQERKYALTRVAAGDYLLPSNDGKVLWRIAKYKDGPSYGLVVDWKRDHTFWGVWRWADPRDFRSALQVNALTDDPLGDWNLWEMVEGNHETRAEAIDRALTMT